MDEPHGVNIGQGMEIIAGLGSICCEDGWSTYPRRLLRRTLLIEAKDMTPEETLIQHYFDVFNRHDIEGVMDCFHAAPAIVDATGTRFEGREEVRRHYETGFALMPDCRCDLRMLTGNSGRGVAESFFHGTRPRYGKVIEAIGAEVIEIMDGRIKEIRDYHRPLSAKAD
jgi:ketosteroid isomerase-like protein